jgi:glycosyltransferase involved in cell wall biosynthesis
MTSDTPKDQETAWPLVSVLFVTYKRFDLLKVTVETFLRETDYPNLELVVADDASGVEVQNEIRTLPVDVFAFAPKNRGLGANNNIGLRHCKGDYILMLQDDWECHGPRDYLRNAVGVMQANAQIGIINFVGANHPPDLSQRLSGSEEPCYVTPKPLQGGHMEYFLYSDNPHVRSRAMMDFMGYYIEDRDMEKCEIDYNFRWRDQKQFLTAVFPSYYRKTFVHVGAEHSYRTTRLRYRVAAWLQPLKPILLKTAPGIFRFGKSTVVRAIRMLERLRVIR